MAVYVYVCIWLGLGLGLGLVFNQIKSNMTLIMVDKPQPSYNLLLTCYGLG